MLVYADIVAAHEYLVRVFGLKPDAIVRDDQGTPVHAELHAGDTLIYLHPVAPDFRVASPADLGGDTAGLDVIVEGIDTHFQHAEAEGAEILYRPAVMPYGVREYGARDLEGRLWSFMEPLD